MVKTCCALKCRNRSKKPGTSFFCFPKSPERKAEWVRRIKRSWKFQPSRHTVLCSDHFASHCFLNDSVPEFLNLIGLDQKPLRRRLTPEAVPTLFKKGPRGIWEEGNEAGEPEDPQAQDDGGSNPREESKDEGELGKIQIKQEPIDLEDGEVVDVEEEMEEEGEEGSDEDIAAAAALASGCFDIPLDVTEGDDGDADPGSEDTVCYEELANNQAANVTNKNDNGETRTPTSGNEKEKSPTPFPNEKTPTPFPKEKKSTLAFANEPHKGKQPLTPFSKEQTRALPSATMTCEENDSEVEFEQNLSSWTYTATDNMHLGGSMTESNAQNAGDSLCSSRPRRPKRNSMQAPTDGDGDGARKIANPQDYSVEEESKQKPENTENNEQRDMNSTGEERDQIQQRGNTTTHGQSVGDEGRPDADMISVEESSEVEQNQSVNPEEEGEDLSPLRIESVRTVRNDKNVDPDAEAGEEEEQANSTVRELEKTSSTNDGEEGEGSSNATGVSKPSQPADVKLSPAKKKKTSKRKSPPNKVSKPKRHHASIPSPPAQPGLPGQLHPNGSVPQKTSSKDLSSSRKDPRSVGSGPVLYRMDPAFCSLPTVFEVPFNTATPFLSRSSRDSTTGGAPVFRSNGSDRCRPTSVAAESNIIETQNEETATTAKKVECKSDAGKVDRKCSATVSEPRPTGTVTPPCIPHYVGDSDVCTLACCVGKSAPSSLPIKQETKSEHDKDDDLSRYQESMAASSVMRKMADEERAVPRTSTPKDATFHHSQDVAASRSQDITFRDADYEIKITEIPYRSQPMHLAAQAIRTQSGAVSKKPPLPGPVPYRSVPLRTVHDIPIAMQIPCRPTSPVPNPAADKLKRSSPADDDPDYVPIVERPHRSKKPSRIKCSHISEMINVSNKTAVHEPVTSGHVAGSRGLLCQQLLQTATDESSICNRPSTSSKHSAESPESAAASATTHRLALPHTSGQLYLRTQVSHPGLVAVSSSSLMVSQAAPSSSGGSTSSLGMSSGPIFIRSEHVLGDLLDVFKHSSDRIHRRTVFKLCNRVSSPPPAGEGGRGAPGASPSDSWEEVEPKRLFTLFWKECLKVYFVGYEQKVPRLDQQQNSSDVPYVLGQVLRHGLVLCGYWPVALSPACAVSIFTGEKCSSHLLLPCLLKVMHPYEAQALEDLRSSATAAAASNNNSTQAQPPGHRHRRLGSRDGADRFLAVRGERMLGVVVQTYGGTHCKVPTSHEEVEAFVVELASYYLYCQPFWWLREMRRGLLALTAYTHGDQDYLSSMTEAGFLEMYRTLDPTPQALLHRIAFKSMQGGVMDSRSQRLKEYLERSFLKLNRKELIRLVEGWSKADCLLDEAYFVSIQASASAGPGGAMGGGTPPYFRPSHNTLVLGHCSPSFELFRCMFQDFVDRLCSK